MGEKGKNNKRVRDDYPLIILGFRQECHINFILKGPQSLTSGKNNTKILFRSIVTLLILPKKDHLITHF